MECEIPRICLNVGTEQAYVSLPNFLSIDPHPYDPSWYEDDIEDDEILDDEGRGRLKLRVENTIRWRNAKNPDGTEKKESNANIVEWSDGSLSLHLGTEIFDIIKHSVGGKKYHIFVRQGTGLQGQAVFDNCFTFRPHSTESFTHRKLTLSLADRSQKTQKIRLLHNVGQDPEARLNELGKKEEDKLKASLRRETKARRVQERSQTKGPTASYLEPDYEEEDDEGGVSLSAIKREAWRRGTSGSSRQFVDSDDDSDSDADDQNDSDDSDPEFGRRKTRASKQLKVVEDSDDGDEE